MKTVRFKVNDAEMRSAFLDRFLPDAIGVLEEDTDPSWGQMTAQLWWSPWFGPWTRPRARKALAVKLQQDYAKR